MYKYGGRQNVAAVSIGFVFI